MPRPVRTVEARGWVSSPIIIAYAVRYHEIGGVAVCDVVNPSTGFWAERCPVVGVTANPIDAPEEEWHGEKIDTTIHPLVVVAVVPETQGPPVVLGALFPSFEFVADGTPTASDDRASYRDAVVQNGGSRVVVKRDGKVFVNAAADVTVVLPAGGKMHVIDGDASEHAAPAGPVHDRTLALAAAINAIESRMAGAVAPPGGGAIPTLASTTQTVFNFSVGQLQSSAVRIPAKTEADP